jgi:phosphorylase kinase gamma subunit
MVASLEEDTTDSLPDKNFSKELYAKYELKNVLGRGVSSTVRKCIEKSTHKEYAVKIVDLTQEKDNEDLTEQVRQSTKKEIDILRQCAEHSNIIELHDVFESEAFVFLIFELCKKGELFDYLTEVVTLSEKRARQVMKQLLSAVEYIHARGIVHRDLKPENILMDDNFNVKLSDFGFATEISHDEELTELCGTPGYLAPEALKVSMYDDVPGYGRPVDMWASGVIMYTLLAGCPPFWHRRQLNLLRMIMEGRYTFTSPEWDDISENAKDLISRLLVVDPRDRLTAAEALCHPFFKREEIKEIELKFLPRRKFRASTFVVVAMNRIRRMHAHPAPIHIDQMTNNPYALKALRKTIDCGAFKIYGHWVKRGENQNRAALFENDIKRDIKLSTSSNVKPESLSKHFEKFSPVVNISDRIGRDQLWAVHWNDPPQPLLLLMPSTAGERVCTTCSISPHSTQHHSIVAEVAAREKKLGYIEEQLDSIDN